MVFRHVAPFGSVMIGAITRHKLRDAAQFADVGSPDEGVDDAADLQRVLEVVNIPRAASARAAKPLAPAT